MSESSPSLDPEILRAANISPTTLLATDYLNHFNEVLMLIEMLPHMPECVEDVYAWRPMGYEDYFAQSTFKEKDLAITAYGLVPDARKQRFETLVGSLDEKVFALIEQVSSLSGDGPSGFEQIAFTASTEVRPLLDQVSALINDSEAETDWMLAVDHPTAQDEVDRLFD